MSLPTESDRAEGRAPATFLAFMALMSSVIALSIDAVLPALDSMAADLNMAGENDRQLVITFLFLGFGLSQLVSGTASDFIGRKRAAMIGWGIFVVGSLMSMFATSPEMMYAGRALQGFGAGGPRVVAIAIVRDLYEGRPMARIMSLIMMIFILVPMLAPLLGQVTEWIAGWRAIFALFLMLALVSGTWYLLGVPETLPPERRPKPEFRSLSASFVAVVSTRTAMCYTVAMGCVFGAFVSWLGTSQQILEEAYGLGPWFPLAFAALALVMGIASWANSRLVIRLGMRRLVRVALLGKIVLGLTGLATAWLADGLPALPVFMVLMSLVLFPTGLLFSNFNALAMEPLGQVAGIGSSVVQFVATSLSVPLGWAIGQEFTGDVMPLFAAYAVLATCALAMTQLAGARPVPVR